MDDLETDGDDEDGEEETEGADGNIEVVRGCQRDSM